MGGLTWFYEDSRHCARYTKKGVLQPPHAPQYQIREHLERKNDMKCMICKTIRRPIESNSLYKHEQSEVLTSPHSKVSYCITDF